MTLTSLIALYFAAGAACAALDYRRSAGSRWHRGARAAAMFAVWPLWAPFVLLR